MALSEQQLIKQAKNGDRNALGILFKKYTKKILYLIYDITGNYEDARDLSQSVFLKANLKFDQFRGTASLGTWLYRIAINTVNDWHRKSRKNPVQLKEGSSYDFNTVQDYNPESEPDMQPALDLLIQKLSENQRTVIILKYFHSRTSRQIADVLGCSEATVRTHVFRAVNNLKTLLSCTARKTEAK